MAAALACAALLYAALSAGLTAWFAHALRFSPALGSAWLSVRGYPVHAPWRWLAWRDAIAQHDPESPLVTGTTSAALTMLWLAIGVGALVLYRRQAQNLNRIEELHGSAHFATPDEVRASGLLGQDEGILLADWHDPTTGKLRYLRHRGAAHSMIVGPTRCGKDAGNGVPNALTWRHSMIATDPKGDLWKLTSGALAARGHRVLRFELGAPADRTARTNPLERIRLGTHHEIADAQLLAASLLHGDYGGNSVIFVRAARPLLAACFLHVLYRERALGNPPASFRHVVGEFLNPARPYEDMLREWHTFAHDPHHERDWRLSDGSRIATHPMVASCALSELTCADKRLTENVRFTIRAVLELFHDRSILESLSASDFGIEDLVTGDRPTAVYLVYPHAQRERLTPILRMLLEQTLHRLTEQMGMHDGRPGRPHEYRLLLLLNEFPLLGKMDVIESALPICASFGIHANLYMQDLQQLRATYGQHETISTQCGVRVFYPPNDAATARDISEALGKATAIRRAPGRRGRGGDEQSESARELASVDELMRMRAPERYFEENGEERIRRAGDVIVMKTGHPPIHARQILYWKDPGLRALVAEGAAQIRMRRQSSRSEASPARPAEASGTATAAAPSPETHRVDDSDQLDGELAALDRLRRDAGAGP